MFPGAVVRNNSKSSREAAACESPARKCRESLRIRVASPGGTARGTSPPPPLKMNFIFKIPDDILDHVILKNVVLTKLL
jgi:hypothetical protein